MRTAVVVFFIMLAAALAWPTPWPTPAPAPSPAVQWYGNPGTSYALSVRPLGVTPDGDARAFVAIAFRDASGAPAKPRHGTDFDYAPSRGTDQWQTRLRFDGPGTIVSLRDEGPVTVRVRANRPAGLGTQSIAFDTRTWTMPRVVAGAVGPHLVRIGWFPRVTRGAVRIERVDAAGVRRGLATVAAPASTWTDDGVVPGTPLQYAVVRPGRGRTRVTVAVPPDVPRSDVAAVRGKGAWLAFSGDPLDPDGYRDLDPDLIAQTAKRAGLRYVELRLAYGAFDEVTPEAKATVDAVIDKLSESGIAVLGWTVPRAVSYEDLARNAAVAAYRTPRGTTLAGLAVDVERGDEFLGDGAPGFTALSTYLHELRRAVGRGVLLVATVEDPFLERLDARRFPYAAIARDADVLQPMTYWRMLGPWDSIEKARTAVAGSIAAVRRLAGRDLPINVGAQTTSLSKRGAPPGPELAAAIAEARAHGALGVTLYDWGGTWPAQWDAVAGEAW